MVTPAVTMAVAATVAVEVGAVGVIDVAGVPYGGPNVGAGMNGGPYIGVAVIVGGLVGTMATSTVG